MTYLIHTFHLQARHADSPIMRRFLAVCECGWKGPAQRDRDSAIEDGYAHQESEQS